MFSAVLCLATAVYFEARSEPLVGQVAVAEVIMNRAEHAAFPDTVCDVVKQDLGPKAYDCQFSFYCDGVPEEVKNAAAWFKALEVAAVILEEGSSDTTGGALYYHTTSIRRPGWSKRLHVTTTIGDHLFLR